MNYLELIKYGLPVLAFVISFVSLLVANANWRQSNRPIVVAIVRTSTSSSAVIKYDLVIYNAGSRPATNVRMTADLMKVAACLSDLTLADDSNVFWKAVCGCFSPKNYVPVLVQGKETTNSFGVTGEEIPFWKYRSSFPIEIAYADLDGKNYVSRQALFIQDSEAFADTKWG